MKNLKTTIKLSVLALACLGAGALALQPTATAQAATEYTDCIHMVNGAAVCVKDGFSGIRWKSKVYPAKYQAMIEGAETVTIGTLVMPTKDIGEDGELTEADIANGALKLPANIDYTALATSTADEVEFYTVVDFTDVADEDKQDAYSMELTAHTYIEIDGKYYFDNLGKYDVSRSARQVAWSAELDGDLDEMTAEKAAKAAAYYNPKGTRHQITEENKNTGAPGTAVIDLSACTTSGQEVEVAFTLPENEEIKEVLIDTENVEFEYNTDDHVLTLNIAKGQTFPTGETYVAICTDKGFYTEHIIGATKVFDEMSDFNDFAYIRTNITNNKITTTVADGIDASKLVHDGYYVLSKDIEDITGTYYLNEYGHASGTTSTTNTKGTTSKTWVGIANFVDKPFGLTGTFNGLGHKLPALCASRSRTGLFEFINGGTVKNLAFTRFLSYSKSAYTAALAYFAIDPKIENVYIYVHENFRATYAQHVMFDLLYQSEENAAQFNNVYLDVFYNANAVPTEAGHTGGIIRQIHSGGNPNIKMTNVYSINNVGLCYGLESGYINVEAEDGTTTRTAVTYVSNYNYGENQKAAYEGGTIYGPNGAVNATCPKVGQYVYTDGKTYNVYTLGEDKQGNETEVSVSQTARYISGIYQYYTADDFKAAKHDLASFTGTAGAGCWTVKDGVLGWHS